MAARGRADDLETQIFNTQAKSAAGLAIKLEIALHRSQHASMVGRPFNDQDTDTQAIWRTLEDAEKLARAS